MAKRQSYLLERLLDLYSEICRCEDELLMLQVVDMDDLSSTADSLWKNYRLIQSGHAPTPAETLGQYEVSPCRSVSALLERTLSATHGTELLLRGCTIVTQDKSVRWYISGELDERTSAQIRV